MMRMPLVAAVLILALVPAVAHGQNREHLQMNADLRILQEHVSRLQLTVNRLQTELEATNKRLDDVSSGSVKGFADQQLLINQLASALTTVRERLDDNTVRVSQLTQEFTAVREGVRLLTDQINTLVSLLQPNLPTGETPPADGSSPAPPAAGSAPAAPTAAAGSGPLDPVILPVSASRIYQQAMNDYMAARYDIAIEGFQDVIDRYPDSPDAARAQFQIGQSLVAKNNCRDAIAAYQKFVDTYPSADWRAEGLFMLGFCYNDINQRTNAQRAFERVIKEYPESAQAIQAASRLEAMGAKP